MKAYSYTIECNDGPSEDPHQKYGHVIAAENEAAANAIIDLEFKNRKMYSKEVVKVYDLDAIVNDLIKKLSEVDDLATSLVLPVTTPLAGIVDNPLRKAGYQVTSRKWRGAETDLNIYFFPRKVLRTRTFCPEKFEGDLEGAIKVLPDSQQYMYLNGVVWFVKSPKFSGQKRVAVDTGLRYKDIIQDAETNHVLENIKRLME